MRVVLTDRQMPGMSGVELAAAVLERGIPAVVTLITGFPILSAKPPGVFEQLEKPIGVDDLSAHMDKAFPEWESVFA